MDTLSPREYHIALLIGNGLTNKEIAHELGISKVTVRNRVHKILAKLGARNRYGVCRWLGAPTAVGEVDGGGDVDPANSEVALRDDL